MKKIFFLIISVILCIVTVLIPCSVLAKDGKVAVSSPSSAGTGEFFEVTIAADAGSDCIGTFQSKISYDTKLMEYVSGGGNSVQISKGSGAISYTGSDSERAASFTLRFKALAEGTAKINVTFYLSGFNSGKTLVDSSKSVSVEIGKPVSKPTATPEALPTDSTNEEMYFYVHDVPYRIMDTVPDNAAGLIIASGVYNGKSVPTAYFAGNTEKAYFFAENMLYANKDTALLYDIQTGTFAAYIPVAFSGTYVITEWEKPLPGFSENTVPLLSEKVTHSAGEEFILVRAKSAANGEGYYFYDIKEGTLQRAITEE